MAVYQNGIDVSRYQGNINWGRVAAAGKQFAIVRVGSSNSGGLYVDPYFLQNVNGAKAAGLRVGAYYYTYARTRAAVANELTTFLNVMQGLQLEYPVFVDVEDASLTSLGRAELVRMRDEDPTCEVVCHFCHSKYQYDLNALLAEYDAQAAEAAQSKE